MAAPLLALGRLATWAMGKKAPKIAKTMITKSGKTVAHPFAGQTATGYGPSFVRSLYSGGSKLKKGTLNYAQGVTTPKYLPKVTKGGTYQKGLFGAGKKLTTAGQHLKKHRRAYGWGATGAVAWDVVDDD